MTAITDKRIAVTGGAGFLGSFLLEQLEAAGAGELIVPRIENYDLTEQDAVRQMYADAKPDIVIHLAAEVGGIGANRANPGRYFYANMAMGLHLIEEARKHKIEKFVQVGTVCAYPKYAPVPFREEDLWNGYPEETNAPYGIAKKSLLVMLQAYRQQYNLNGIYLLPVNLYGPRDNFDLETSHVIPALIRKFVTARDEGAAEVVAWGTGSASREFLFVKDAARALVMATDRYNGDQPVNVGTSHEITIRELVELIAKLTGYEGTVRWDTSKPDGQPRRKLDTTKAAQLFEFEAGTGLEEGLRETIEWWETHGAS
ncbi:MAG: GDP-L-fucose synthase [Acidimicrobiia bacterium]|nr:GDP-L-fucose synthase [Acidimicrobiia bacterium]